MGSISLARLINPCFTPFTMRHDHRKVRLQLSLLSVHSFRYVKIYVDFDAWNCSSTENARSREAPRGIESSSNLSPELRASILRRKSSTLSRPCGGEFIMSRSQFMFGRLVLSTAMFALSNSSMQDRCIPPMRSLWRPLSLLASTPSSVRNGSMSWRSDNATGFDGSWTMALSRVVAAVTKM